jgi:apolipoprotein N-acyltransferase
VRDEPALLRRPATTAVAIAAGVVATALAYPPHRVPGLGLVMLAPIAFVLDGVSPRRAFALAWLYSGAFALWSVRWVIHALVVEYQVAVLPAWIFLSIVVFSLALVPAAAGALYAALRPRLRTAAAPLAFAAIWTLGEWLRGSLLGTPWLLAAQTVTRWPMAIQAADLGGHYAVSFVLLASGAGIGIALRRRSVFALLAPLAIAGLWLGYGAATRDDHAGRRTAAARRHRAGIGAAVRALPRRLGGAQRRASRSRDANARRRRAARPRRLVRDRRGHRSRPDAGTSRAARTPRHRDRRADRDGRAALARNEPQQCGGAVRTGARPRRVVRQAAAGALLRVRPGAWRRARGVDRSGRRRRSVPAGTRGDRLPDPRDPVRATGRFEISYPDLVRGFRAAGARLLVNLSNDAWFGPIGYPEMHFDHAIYRAVEMRMPVVRGANTGISGVIDAAGRVTAAIPAFEEGTLRAEVAAAGAPSLYARTGDWPLVTGLLLLLAATLRSGRRRPPGAALGAGRRRSG